MEERRFCTNCGKEILAGVKFCSNCGKEVLSQINSEIKKEEVKEEVKNDKTVNIEKVQENKQSYNNSINNNLNEYCSKPEINFENKDMVNFIQKNAEYYIPKFQEMQMKSSSISWNWASFLAGAAWFLYRKMYAIGFGIIAGNFILTLLMPFIAPVTTIAIPIACGLFGNNLYMKFIQNKLNTISNMDENMKKSMIMTQGGVNIVIPIIVVVIVVIILIMLVSLGIIAAGLVGLAYY